MADTTTTTSLPARRASTMRCATRLIFSASPTEEPPYFCTTSAITDLFHLHSSSAPFICTGRTLSLRNMVIVEDSARATPGCSTDFHCPGSRSDGMQQLELTQGDGHAPCRCSRGVGRTGRVRCLHRDLRVPPGLT